MINFPKTFIWNYFPLIVRIIVILFLVGGGILAYQYWRESEREDFSLKLSDEKIKLLLGKCESISPFSKEKENCYVQLGRLSKDLHLCDKISEPAGGYGRIYWQAYCYGGVAVEKKDGKICRKLRTENIDILDGCYNTVAEILDDPDICLLAPNEYRGGQTLCIAYLAALKMNPDICEKLKRIGKCQCYMNLANTAWGSGANEIYEEASKRIETEKCFPE